MSSDVPAKTHQGVTSGRSRPVLLLLLSSVEKMGQIKQRNGEEGLHLSHHNILKVHFHFMLHFPPRNKRFTASWSPHVCLEGLFPDNCQAAPANRNDSQDGRPVFPVPLPNPTALSDMQPQMLLFSCGPTAEQRCNTQLVASTSSKHVAVQTDCCRRGQSDARGNSPTG